MGSSRKRPYQLAAFAMSAFLAILFFSNHIHQPDTSDHAPDASHAQNVEQRAQAEPVQPIQTEDFDPIKEFFKMGPTLTCSKQGVFTIEDLKEHMTEQKLWISLQGYVYDVTEFLPHHPGGKALLSGAGKKDASDYFSQYHQPHVIGMLAKFCIGKLVG